MLVYEIIEESARKWPNKPAIYDELGTLTFSELRDQVNILRQNLQDLGLAEGMGLGVMARNSRSFIIACFAGLGCSAIILPISHQIKTSELDLIISETGLHVLLDDKNGVTPHLDTYSEVFVMGQVLRYSRTSFSAQYKIATHIENAAFIRFTSGTTGKSKGVVISHQSILERIEAANKGLALGTEDTVICVLPMAYHFIVSIILYLKFGSAIAICNDFLAHAILNYSNKFKGTLLYASPMHIRLLASDQSGESFTSLKKVISTSTSIPHQMCAAFEKRYGIEVSQAYGIIEIGLPILNLKNSKEHPESVGYALPDYEVEILDENLQSLPNNEAGHLAIKGPGMFDGYLTPPVVRSKILKEEWFLTGDLATKDDDGLIKIVGRKKSMINVSGNKVFPEEVEQVVETHPAIKECRVYGGMHPLMGEIVQAEIVLKEDYIIESEELIGFCREKLSTYKIPQKITFVKNIEITDSGKKIRV